MLFYLNFIPAVITTLLLSAHYLRYGNTWIAILIALSSLFLFLKKRWIFRLYQGLLVFTSIEFIITTYKIAIIRMEGHQDYLRMIVILLSVSLFSLLSAVIINRKKTKDVFNKSIKSTPQSFSTFLIIFITLSVITEKVPIELLLTERFFPSLTVIQIFLMSFYGAYIVDIFLNTNKTSNTRSIIWTLFSIIFFLQLILGLIGNELFLQTGKLHAPIPALVFAAPISRGSGFFMITLFASTLLLVGPAWCSHLCYIGSIDNIFSKFKIKSSIKKDLSLLRIPILILFIVLAIIFRYIEITGTPITILLIIFSIVSIITIFLSAKFGIMLHCTSICPLGLLANIFGKINPFRIKIDNSCDQCLSCINSCKYGALNIDSINRKNPTITCSLCGDCLNSCPNNSIAYRFPFLSSSQSKSLFIVVIVTVHTLFLSIARI